MGFPKYMEDNEELWCDNNFYTSNNSMYGFRRVSEAAAKTASRLNYSTINKIKENEEWINSILRNMTANQ